MIKITILGAGSLGATLAYLFSKNSNVQIKLWDRSEDKIQDIRNKEFFPSPSCLKLNQNIYLTTDFLEACKDTEIIICAIPSEHVNQIIQKIKDLNINIKILLSGTKGIDNKTSFTMSQLWNSHFPQAKIIALSGPNLSEEIANNKPMRTVLACKEIQYAQKIKNILENNLFKVEIIEDIIGLELCGAVKNVIAVMAGAWDGFDLGTSGKGCLLTKALEEIRKFVELMSGSTNTINTVGGIGDLFITCSSALSRNYRTGLLLTKGYNIEKIKQELNNQVSEGIFTAELIHKLSLEKGFNFSICEKAYELLHTDLSKEQNFLKMKEIFINLI